MTVGDIVLVRDDDQPRGRWPLDRVVTTFPGAEGCVRSVEVRTKRDTFKRSAQKLCLLEEVRLPTQNHLAD